MAPLLSEQRSWALSPARRLQWRAKRDSPAAAVCPALWQGPAWSLPAIPGTEPSRQQKLVDATCLGQGHLLLPKITHVCLCLDTFVLLLERRPPPTVAQSISLDKEVNRRSEDGSTLPQFNSINGTHKSQNNLEY